MSKLSTSFNEVEKRVIDEMLGSRAEILSEVEGKCFVLDSDGEYSYNTCFEPTDKPFFAKQKYKLFVPIKIIKFFDFYFMYSEQEEAAWYRGVKNKNGNYEFDCYGDTLEELTYSL